MATSKLDLSNLSIVDSKFYVIDANKTNPKYAGNKVDGVADELVTFDDGSTLTDGGKFTAASGAGTFSVVIPAEVKDADVAAIAAKAKTIAAAAVAKLGSSAKDTEKKAAAVAALKDAAAEAGANTLNSVVYLAAAGGVSDALSSAGEVDTSKIDALSEVFGSASVSAISLTGLDFSSASGAVAVDAGTSSVFAGVTDIVGSDYADKLTLGAATADASVAAGDGNDVVTVKNIASNKNLSIDLGDGDDILNIASGVASGTVAVTLGDGKDVVNVADAKATVNISDYSYADGDKINLTYADAAASLAADGVALATISGNVDVASIAVGGVAATVKASDAVAVADITGGKDTVTFYTATDAKKDVEINAKSISNKAIIDAGAANSANITLGSGDSVVSLAAAGKEDVVVATGAKTAAITNFTEKEDVLVLDGAKLGSISLANVTNNSSTNAALTYGKTTVTLAGLGNAAKTIRLNDADTTLAYDLAATGTTLEAGADMYYGNADGKTTVETTDTVHLADADKYKNIYNVSVIAGTTDADKLDLSGFTTSGSQGISIDATKSDVAVNVWAYNKNTKATDTIALGTGALQDTVSFASDDGKVSVSGFAFGTGDESDILYLRDTQDLQKLSVKQGAMKIGSSQLGIGHVAGGNDLLQVKLADGTTSLVAGNFDNTTASTVAVTVGADAVDFYALSGTKNALSVAKDTNAEDAVSYKYSNFDDNHTAKTLVKSISVTGFGDEDDVTIGAVANASVDGSGKTHIWVCGAAESGTVDISKSTGADQIDFVSGIDKKVAVTGYDADQEDTIFLRGAEDLKAVTTGYKFESKNGGVQISGADNADSKLVLDGASSLNLKTTNGDALKAVVGTADATFAKDTQIYVGMKRIEADTTTEGDIAVRVGTKGEIGLDSSSTYYVSDSVTEFDASNSNAVFHLAGSSTAATTLKGGNTQNSFYGGGSYSDTMVGNSSAVDIFYFGKGDGKDTIQEADGKDTVYLMDVSLDDITIDTKTNTIAINASDTLTFGSGAEEALTAGELTFNIGGSSYVCKDGKMVAKEA